MCQQLQRASCAEKHSTRRDGASSTGLKVKREGFAALLYHQFHGQITYPGYASIILPIKGGETS